ncbi:MAG: butyrate kinase [Bacteroidales bacterium]|nr:butyrate kinase [Bacteroidales bacterium]
MKILAINPGSTSTKMAVYEDKTPLLTLALRHSVEDLEPFPRVIDQFDFRKNLILKALADNGIPFEFDAVIGRGGLLRPIPGGVYEVNEAMIADIFKVRRSHACNLGCIIASDLAKELGCKAFIADPGVVDELEEIARVTGSPLMPRATTWHALNQRAIARRFAAERSSATGKKMAYEDFNLIICHLGGGISIGAHKDGKAIDVNNAFDGEGPFSPERAGSLPSGSLIDLCYSGRYSKDELKKRISGNAGLAAHLGTTHIPEILERIENGDDYARLVLDAMIYQIAKHIASLGPVFYGKIDAILVTGGIAYSDYVVSRLKERIEYMAPVYIYPGEDELEALALNALGALNGELPVQVYTQKKAKPLHCAEPQLN